MKTPFIDVDVLCIGHASYDLVFSVDHHPAEDEKTFATGFVDCGGGPAANAAIMVANLGFRAAFAGYLGADFYGDKHLQELIDHGVETGLIVRGPAPTPISTVLVKPDGKRALINYKIGTQPLPADALDFTNIRPQAVLFDGHEPDVSAAYCRKLRGQNIPTVLDAGSLHAGTQALISEVDYLVCSEKFALQIAGSVERALRQLAEIAPNVVITLSENGLFWRRGAEHGFMPAFKVADVDSTGAGDAFHGAFAAAVSQQMDWIDSLRYAAAAGALCCTKMGARPGMPTREDHRRLFEQGDLKQ
ncbi:PfkB family carbohydrate kinase [Methylomicrobium sp. Wu6]|uniref:carbohydrate kinase family protein n=1 Tax=Methylomicrobium sp. Wu6 TaxID=3107928 RepID=UPI002DD6418C|nr:PfkB family carbohydrate kinase [Methylomicrobium sp. Wu6]MEC4749132.1 PfkB family carbohydrate kinase [Methylomicrobium sp. Wu6]